MKKAEQLCEQTEVFRIYEEQAGLECGRLAAMAGDSEVKSILKYT